MNYNITPEEVYIKLKDNKEILEMYKQIEQNETGENAWAFHNYNHVKNVSDLSESILTELNFDKDTIYKVKIASLLHDVGAVEGKEGHQQRSFEFAKNLFEKNNWIFDGKDEVLDAIKNHSAGFDTDNVITLSIILADKLDIKKTRISEVGKTVIGNRQYQHINDIIIDIKDNVFTVNFITDSNMDIKEASEYYFTVKVFKAIKAFCTKLNLKYNIVIDNTPWK